MTLPPRLLTRDRGEIPDFLIQIRNIEYLVELPDFCVQVTVRFRTLGLKRSGPGHIPVVLTGDSPRKSETVTRHTEVQKVHHKIPADPKFRVDSENEPRNVISPCNRELEANAAPSDFSS